MNRPERIRKRGYASPTAGALTWLTLVLNSLVGCSTPIAYQVYDPVPTTTQAVSVQVRDVTRGTHGGVISLTVVNRSADVLAFAQGSRVVIHLTPTAHTRGMTLDEFNGLVDRQGSIAMGFKHWRPRSKEIRLDPIGAMVNLPSGQETLLHVAFALPPEIERVTLDVGPALEWRGPSGQPRRLDTPVTVDVPLPAVPSHVLPTRDEWQRNVHVGVGISSNGF